VSRSWLRSTASVRLTLLLSIALLSAAGYLLTSRAIDHDLRADSARRAGVESIRVQALLDRARASVVGLGNVLADEPIADQRRFSELVGSTSGSLGLVDALWVRRAPGSTHLIAAYATGARPGPSGGLDISNSPILAGAIRDAASTSAVAASDLGSLGGERGFYLVERASFGRGPNSRGYLAVFVPSDWVTLQLGQDPHQVAVSFDDGELQGPLRGPAAASATISAFGRDWRIAVTATPVSGVQSLVPWLALAWPVAVALLTFLVGNAVVRRRRAEREVERIFDFSLDMMGTVGLDGFFKRVNPAFERILGYSREQLLTQPLLDFVHPADVPQTRSVLDALAAGRDVSHLENRLIGRDGGVRWLEWSVRPAPAEGLVYAGARDVTDRRRAELEAQRARRMLEASRAELLASRARVVAAGDEARRRIERDLHDGTQQRLVSIALALRATETKVPDELAEVRRELTETAAALAGALEDLQEISRGIHPAILSSGGLEVALKGLARRAAIPVELDVQIGRSLPEPIEVAIYYVVSEGLTNAAKHARASHVCVSLRAEAAFVSLAIEDDGEGGADPSRGSGLIGLADRIEVLGGTLEVSSQPGRGTALRIEIPV
jgi:PAS domain S-box-containing protein